VLWASEMFGSGIIQSTEHINILLNFVVEDRALSSQFDIRPC